MRNSDISDAPRTTGRYRTAIFRKTKQKATVKRDEETVHLSEDDILIEQNSPTSFETGWTQNGPQIRCSETVGEDRDEGNFGLRKDCVACGANRCDLLLGTRHPLSVRLDNNLADDLLLSAQKFICITSQLRKAPFQHSQLVLQVALVQQPQHSDVLLANCVDDLRNLLCFSLLRFSQTLHPLARAIFDRLKQSLDLLIALRQKLSVRSLQSEKLRKTYERTDK
jgi:hypothetical protein